VTDLEIGQKVAIFPVLTDDTCDWCQQEIYGLCDKWGFLGYSGYGGGFAEFISVDRKAIHKIPDNVSLDVAALVEPLTVAWHAVKIAALEPDKHALVVGAGKLENMLFLSTQCLIRPYLGPIGIAVVHCLIAHGVNSIVVSEPSQMRRFHAQEAGAAYVLDPTNTNISSFCHTLGDGYGAHAVFDCAGVQAAFDVAIASVRGKGTIINIALYETPLTIQTPNVLNKRSISYIGSNIYTRGEFQAVIDALASGKSYQLFQSMCLANTAACRQNKKRRKHDNSENIFEECCGGRVRRSL
jgi:threonine dehydrogenase-like Zn-dependent dehydrogenase